MIGILSQRENIEFNDRAILSYFRYRYNCDTESIFKDINKIPQGHYVTMYEDGSTDLKRFWNPPQSFDPNIETVDIAKSLSASVKERLVADVVLMVQDMMTMMMMATIFRQD